MSSELNSQEEDLLQSALSSAFTPPDVPRVAAQPPSEPASAASPQPEAAAAAEATPTLGSSDFSVEEEWKADYEAHVAEWRARSAEQRTKAEVERARWEKIREEEEREGKRLGYSPPGPTSSAASTSGWVNAVVSEGQASPSPADARDLVSGEVSRGTRQTEPSSTLSSPPVTVSNEATHADSEPEYVPSELTSSYPSLDYPSDENSPTSGQQSLPRHKHDHRHAPHNHRHHAPPQTTATSAVFDGTLSKRTRLFALASSLAINLLLPFINGVMLGFGELFARNVVIGWFGWKIPGSTAANLGLRRGQGVARKRDL